MGFPQNRCSAFDTKDPRGGTYQVVLTYIAWGFDWQAHYVATLDDAGKGAKTSMALRSWLTIVNTMGRSPRRDAAGGGRQAQHHEQFPVARHAAGGPAAFADLLSAGPHRGRIAERISQLAAAAPSPPPMMVGAMEDAVVVTAARAPMKSMDSPAGGGRLGRGAGRSQASYRIPMPLTVAAKSMKQVAFLDRKGVTGELQYRSACSPWNGGAAPEGLRILLRTKNDRQHGLGGRAADRRS